MRQVRVPNTSDQPVMVPAGDRFSLVLSPGEFGTVCPEGLRGEGEFFDLMARGRISPSAYRQPTPRFFPLDVNGDFNRAA